MAGCGSAAHLSAEREIAIFRIIEEALPDIYSLSVTHKDRWLIVELELP